MAGISEKEAMARKRQGMGLAKHLGVRPGSERYNAMKYGTARAYGWKPSRETRKGGLKEAMKSRRKKRRAKK